MTGLNPVLDHLALVVADLEQARKTYQRMGFTLSPRSSHKGQIIEGGPVELWGAGNHCAMFENGYFEILGITDANRHKEHVEVFLNQYQGLHLIALGCDDANDAALILRKRMGDGPAPYEVGRDIPCLDGSTLPGKFRILHLADEAFDEADLFFIEHLTPDALWQKDIINQANGVVGLKEVMICSQIPDQTCAKLSRILESKLEYNSGVASFQLARGRILIAGPDQLEKIYPGIVPPVLPWVAAVNFAVKNLEETREFLKFQGFDVHETNRHEIWIGLEQSEGAIVAFSPVL